MSDRGFKYDELTEADDASIENVRNRIYACPCGEGVWVSIQTGTVYEGNGGNDRDQWYWQSRGPWVRTTNEEIRDVFDHELDSGAKARVELADLKESLGRLAGCQDD